MIKFEINKSKCTGCGACVNACPYGAIKIGKDGKAFIDQDKCKKCGVCQEICPFNAIEKISEENLNKAKSSETPVPEPSSYKSLDNIEERGLGMGRRSGGGMGGGPGRGMGRGSGRGMGRGPRDGRGGGRGGGGRRY